MLTLDIHRRTSLVLVKPHYPENVGAAARAAKTMGFTRLVLVAPGRLAHPEHEMARKMAVKSLDVLGAALRFDDLREALDGIHWVVATTARRGVSKVRSPHSIAEEAHSRAALGQSVAILFGNEKTGLLKQEVAESQARLRIPLAAGQPSVNLAQAVQIVAYELFATSLAAR